MDDRDMDKLDEKFPAPWKPMTDPVDLKHIGKLGEELGECQAAAMRCLIQGIDGINPDDGKVNREWLQDEIADALANIDLVVERFGLDEKKIGLRRLRKIVFLRKWHNRAGE